jgi:site-specific recombinase XerD
MEQLCLFDTGMVRELKRLEAQRALLASGICHNTELAFKYDWKSFAGWCSKTNRQPLPASVDTLALYVTWLIDRGLRTSTARRHLTTITHMHKAGGHATPAIREPLQILIGARRLHPERTLARAPIHVSELRRICAMFDSHLTRDVRDRALLVFGFTSALRRSNLVALDLADVSFHHKGVLIYIRHEKARENNGRGRWIGLTHGKHSNTCPVRTLRAWLHRRGSAVGPLFTRMLPNGEVTLKRLDGDDVRCIVKQSVASIGLEPERYGAHSLRAGLVSSAAEAGASELVIAKQTGHKSMAVLRTYFRTEDPFRANPCTLLRL